MADESLALVDHVEAAIHVIRGHRVMLDVTLAALYCVPVRILNQAVKRNLARFPADFMFPLNEDEAARVRHGSLASDEGARGRHRKYRTNAFTEQGIAMLSSVLRSERAVQVNIEIMRAFVRLRRMIQQDADLARKVAALEKKYDACFKEVFAAIRELMAPPVRPGRHIGFKPNS